MHAALTRRLIEHVCGHKERLEGVGEGRRSRDCATASRPASRASWPRAIEREIAPLSLPENRRSFRAEKVTLQLDNKSRRRAEDFRASEGNVSFTDSPRNITDIEQKYLSVKRRCMLRFLFVMHIHC